MVLGCAFDNPAKNRARGACNCQGPHCPSPPALPPSWNPPSKGRRTRPAEASTALHPSANASMPAPARALTAQHPSTGLQQPPPGLGVQGQKKRSSNTSALQVLEARQGLWAKPENPKKKAPLKALSKNLSPSKGTLPEDLSRKRERKKKRWIVGCST